MARRSLTGLITLSALLVVAVLLLLAGPAEAFRFTVKPGQTTCFTRRIQEEGRYEVRYRMVRGLAPFVSVAVNAPGGRVLMEHEPARPESKEIITINRAGTIAICFNSDARAVEAVSPNITLEIMDAEDAELTRMKKQSYSTSSPIALGAGQGSGAMQQINYIIGRLTLLRSASLDIITNTEAMHIVMDETQMLSWAFLFLYLAFGVAVVILMYVRMRHFAEKNGL